MRNTMNANKSFTLKVAALAITVATTLVNAQSLIIGGAEVPVDFKIANKSAAPGTYQIVEHRPGLVTVRTNGKNIALATMNVQTTPNSTKSTLRFEQRNGSYHFAGYCIEGRGCFSNGSRNKPEAKMEVALLR